MPKIVVNEGVKLELDETVDGESCIVIHGFYDEPTYAVTLSTAEEVDKMVSALITLKQFL